MKRIVRLLQFALLLALSSPAWGQGTCANFASGKCPANVVVVPSPPTAFYFFDYVGGLDSNTGISESSPWQHMPSCANASGNSAAHAASVAAAEGWILKGGVTIDYHCFPMAPPWNGASSGWDYIGYDPGWYTGGSWARPIFNVGGSGGYSALSQDPISDAAHHGTSYIYLDGLEETGLYIGGTCSSSNANNCGFIAQYAYSGSDTNWIINNVYVHGWTCPSTCTNDPGNSSSFLWVKQDTASQIRNSAVDGSDSSQNCCNAMASWNEYQNYISYVDNAVFGEINFFHDSVITNMVAPSGGVHGNCIHLFGSAAVTELIYNNYISCLNTGTGDELFLVEETGGATVDVYNNVLVKDGHGTGFEIKNSGVTFTAWNNTQECGVDPTPGSECTELYSTTSGATIALNNNFAITNNSNQPTVAGYSLFTSGSFTHLPAFSISCAGGNGNPQTLWGGNQICAPIGSGNGTGNLNISETSQGITQPFAPLDATAASTVGTGVNTNSLCQGLYSISVNAFYACEQDTTLGVSYNSTNHTVTFPARSTNPRPPTPRNGAYEYVPINPYALNADNIYCPASGVPTWGVTDGPAVMPLYCFNTAIVNTPATGSVVNVSNSSQLTSALAAATCGQQITLAAGVVFTGPFTLPALSCPNTNWLWITTSGYSSLPAEGTRVSPCYAGITTLLGRPPYACPGTPGTYTAQIVTPNSTEALTFTAGTNHVRIMGIEFTRTAGTGFVGELIKVGQVGNVDHIIFDRDWLHGDENEDETESAGSFNAVSYIAVVDSYANDFYCISVSGSCTDSHPFFGGVNTTNSTTEEVVKITNTFLEGAGENYISGGGVSNTTPQDQEFRLNTFWKPRQWNPADPYYIPNASGNPFVVKNFFETKNVIRLFKEGNQYSNNWGGFSQNGEAWKLVAVNQANGATNQCPNCQATNIVARYEMVSSSCTLGSIEMNGNANGALPAAENSISIHDIVADNLGYPYCIGALNTFPNADATMNMLEAKSVATTAQILFGATVNHVSMIHAYNAPTLVGALGLGGPLTSTGFQQYNMNFTNNVLLSQTNGTQFVAGDGSSNCADTTKGTPMLTACGWQAAGSSVTGDCFINNGSIPWPSGNVTSLANQSAAYTNWNSGLNGTYTLATGNACKGQATDGSDPGANIALINSILAGNPVFTAPTGLTVSPGITLTPGASLIQ
jgi:hypothetical protein